MKLPFVAAASVVMLTVCTTTQAAPNILVNGGFEIGLASWTTTGFMLQGYDYGIDGASRSGASAFYGGAIDGLGFLRQTLPTVAGQTYAVDLWLASDGYLPNEFQVIASGKVLLDLQDVLIQSYGAVHTVFTASSASTLLEFGFRNDSGSLHLDDVAVSAVPQPVSSVLMALGLGAIFARRRALLHEPPKPTGGKAGGS